MPLKRFMKNRIRILATTDLHGYIYPHRYSDNQETMFGCARLKTLIDLYRDEHTILLDNGDVLQGSSLQFFHYAVEPNETAPITTAMNVMGYDYVNLGNHDFNYGEEALSHHLSHLEMPCITGNVLFHGRKLGASWAVRDFDGVRVAIFGVVTHFIPNWEKKKNIRHYRFQDAFETARKTVEMIRKLEKPDYVIGLYHGSFERDPLTGALLTQDDGENQAYRMISQIPGLDVLITGHTHRTICGSACGTVYVQPGHRGEELACVDIWTDTGVIEPRILKAETAPDSGLLDLLQEKENRCQTWLDEPLGTTDLDLRIRDEFDARLHKSQMVTFVNMVQREMTGADLSASSLFHHATGFGKQISMRDLVSTYVYPNSLCVLKMNGLQLRQYLEKTAEFWSLDQTKIIVNPRFEFPKKKYYVYDMVDGIDYEINVSNDIGSRIVSLTYKGQDVTDDMEFTICVSNYRAAGGSEYSMLRKCEHVKDFQTDVAELIAMWIMKHEHIHFEPVNNIYVHR